MGNNIHSTAQIFGDKVKIGNNVRIDAFCVLTGDVEIKDHVHISTGACLMGRNGKIKIGKYSCISLGTKLLTGTDDFSGGYLAGPQIPEEYLNPTCGNIDVHDAVIVGANSIVFPNVMLGFGCSVGAMTLVKKDVNPFEIVAGHKQRIIGHRNKNRLKKIIKELKDKGW